ncbi:efflux RND transporter periplasmic adaptor subunit [Falsiroseomonas sp. E2-1-a4]|uniref:efflux RND transporter periplasmic adaptor subunit n=1 Tax=Falsiroseomonas sp. E2-1-a4 TaxID=3239299 RepID=UPI003F2BA2B4
MPHLFSRARSGLRCLILCSLLLAAPAFAGPGGPDHKHGPEPTATALPQSPRLVAVSEAWQLVGILKGGALTLYLDRQDDNAPASGATLDLDIAGRTVRAEPQPDGTFRIPAEALGTGEIEVLATIGGAAPDLLVGTIRVPGGAAAPAAAHGHSHALSNFLHRRVSVETVLIALAGTGIGALAVGFLFGRRRAGVAALAVALLAASPVAAGPGGPDHQHGPETATAEDGDAPRRRADGLVFVPKPTQRLLELRTRRVTPEEAARHVTLLGRVLPSPDAQAVVQPATAGRIVAIDGTLPRRGQPVRAGDALALVVPFAAAPGEIAGAETLRAPVDGVIATVALSQGQAVSPGQTLVEILDPGRVRIEAEAFAPLPLAPGAAASIEARGMAPVPAALLGRAPALRGQAALLDFGPRGADHGLEIGRRVQVVVELPERRTAIILPRDAVVQAPNGLPVVFRHAEPELFEPRVVRFEPLDATRVAILTGIEPGEQVLVQGALLVNQIR